MARPRPEQWSAALHQLQAAQQGGQLTTAMVRLVAEGLGVTERSVWRRLATPGPVEPDRFRLSATDRAAYADLGCR